MKEKCQCGKPIVSIRHELWYPGSAGPTLHFKTADRYCDHCGAALCRDCWVPSDWGLDEWEKQLPIATCLCRTCAELLEEQ